MYVRRTLYINDQRGVKACMEFFILSAIFPSTAQTIQKVIVAPSKRTKSRHSKKKSSRLDTRKAQEPNQNTHTNTELTKQELVTFFRYNSSFFWPRKAIIASIIDSARVSSGRSSPAGSSSLSATRTILTTPFSI